MKKCLFVAVVLVQAMAVWGQSNPKATSSALFTISGTPTYTDEFVFLFKKNHPGKAAPVTPASVTEYLDLFINFKLKIKEAHERGLDTTAKFNKELKTYRDEIKKPYRAQKDVLDKLTREAYDHLGQEVRAAHILIQVKPDAAPADTLRAYQKLAEIRARIVTGGEPFDKLAATLSEDPSAKSNGGDLGYFTALQMVYPFEEAAYQTNVGDVSSMIRTRFGYHILKIIDRRPSKGEVEVSHILLRTAKGGQTSRLKNTTDMDADPKVRNLIFDIYDQLKKGRSWDELCQTYSEDMNTKNTGGRLRPFGVGALAAVPEFEATAFALQSPGDISDPFQSTIGWHIVRLEKKIPIPSYAEMEASLKKRVARDERVTLADKAAANDRRKELGFAENHENKMKIQALADSSWLTRKWKLAGSPVGGLPLFVVGNRTWPAQDFFDWAMAHPQATKNLSPAGYFDLLYNGFVDEKVDLAEEDKIIRENPDFRYLLTEYREGILLFEIMEKEVWNKASEDTVGQRKYYEAHRGRYQVGNRVEARIFSTTDRAFLESIKNKVTQGDSITATDLKKFKSVQPFRNYEKGDSKVIDKINWVTGLQQTDIDGTYYLVEVRQLVTPGIKAFGEAKAHVISDYQDMLEKEWVASLRRKYPVTIISKAKKNVVKELTGQ